MSPLILAAAARHDATLRIVGIVFVVIGAFTFTFRRALVARNPEGAPGYARTIGPLASVAFVVIGLVLIAVS